MARAETYVTFTSEERVLLRERKAKPGVDEITEVDLEVLDKGSGCADRTGHEQAWDLASGLKP